MPAFVTAMSEFLTADALWGAITAVAPLLGVVLVFSIGYTIVRRVLKGGSRGRLTV